MTTADPALLLASLTTLRLGGAARELVTATSEEDVVAAVRSAEPPVLVLGGGSNVVVADEGFHGTVVRVATRGISRRDGGEKEVLEVQAGRAVGPVRRALRRGDLAGVECLSGIPGSVGATPIQNVGAYGQEVAETIVRARVYDRTRDRVLDLAPAGLGFGYRTSRLKREPERWVVLAVSFALERSEPLGARALRRAGAGARDPGGRQRAARAGARGRARAAPGQGHGGRHGGPRLRERRLLLHEPDPRVRRLPGARRAGARAARAGRPAARAGPSPTGGSRRARRGSSTARASPAATAIRSPWRSRASTRSR
jgi:UDP-N-acetylenolpyruvoylglucosamine reductase